MSFTPEALENEVEYNYAKQKTDTSDLPGTVSPIEIAKATFSTLRDTLEYRHTESRLQLLDLVPEGRDEAELEWPMAWLRHHDQYESKKR